MTVSFRGTKYAWDSAEVVALFVVVGVVMGFYWIQQFWALGIKKECVSFPLVFLRITTSFWLRWLKRRLSLRLLSRFTFFLFSLLSFMATVR